MQYDKLLVIGNGFDLALGLKTSYRDFMKWLSNKHYMDDAYLYKHLSSKFYQQRWIDIENELRQYSLSFFEIGEMNIKLSSQNERICNSLRYEHKVLCKNLCEYLKIQVNKNEWLETGLENQSIRQLLSKVDKEPLYVINFNYTDTITSFRVTKVVNHHIHGSLSDGENIVFGVEDSSNLTKEHSFLYKSYNPTLNVDHLNERFEDAKHILFYGYSLGQTDHSYFEDFFKEQSTKGCERKKFDFFYYGQEGYDDLFWQLRTLTGNRMAQFKQFNDIEFINTKALKNIIP